MKKLFLNLFVLLALVLTSCSSSDDDNNNDSAGDTALTVTIDGQAYTFNTIVVSEDVDDPDYLNVTATINNQSERVITFYMLANSTGSDTVYYVEYYDNGDYYDSFGSLSAVVSVNNGSRIEATFSGTVTGWDNDAQENVNVVFAGGSLKVSY